jgi:hypothetical protein
MNLKNVWSALREGFYLDFDQKQNLLIMKIFSLFQTTHTKCRQ